MNLLFLAQEAGDEATRLVVPTEIDEIIFGLVAFLIVFAAFWRLVFPRLRKILQDREQAIRSELERAEQARLEAEEEKESYARRIAEARTEADRIIREATEAAEQLRRDRVAKAEDEARQVLEKARTDAEQERDRALNELQRVMADISIEAARRVVERELSDPQAHRQLIESFIASATSGSNGRH